MKTEEQMLRDDLAQCESDGEQMSAELARLRDAVKVLRDAIHRIRCSESVRKCHRLAAEALSETKQLATANLVEDTP